MQIRVPLATAVGAGVLAASGLGLALAGPASAAPTPGSTPPSHGPSVAAPNRVATSAPVNSGSPTRAHGTAFPLPSGAPISAVPNVSGAPGIEVPAGNAGTSSTDRGGVSGVEVAGLVAAGVVLAGGGTVMAIRRRS